MARSLVRRLVSAALLLAVGAGGGGLPILDTLFFHGPDRLAEAFRPHYEASSASCHADGCSIRSLAQSRVVGESSRAASVVAPFEQTVEFEPAPPISGAQVSFPYRSRAPPPSA